MKGHRSSSRDDSDRVKDANHELRAQNRKLRKENAQLRKELQKRANSDFDVELKVEEQLEPAFEPVYREIKKQSVKCSKCNSDELKEIRAGKYLIKVCESCGHKRRTELKA